MSSVPVFAPDGSVRLIPPEQLTTAYSSGGVPAVKMSDTNGTARYIPRTHVADALRSGGKLLEDLSQQPTTQFEKDRNPDNQPGVIHSLINEVGSAIKGGARMAAGAFDPTPSGTLSGVVGNTLAIPEQDAQRKAEGRSTPYRAAAALASVVPSTNVPESEQQMRVGNWRGVLGTALGDAAPIAIGEGLKSPKLRAAVGDVSGRVVAKLPDATSALTESPEFGSKPSAPLFPNKAAAVMPEAAHLPPEAVAGAEDVFRAAAPTGMNKGFRANVYAAAGDLADVGRKIDLNEAKGGIINPDMRVRATVEALRDHLDEMYKTERAPQIERNANVPVKVAGNADAARGLEYLESTAGTEQIRSLATKAIENKALTAFEADTLAQAANQNLKTFEKMTPEGKTQAQITNPKIGGLKALDQELGRNLNDALTANGEPGLRSYERRFAAVSAIRDALESRMNAVELQRTGVAKTIGKVVAPLTGGKAAIASASQAAVSDANIGRTLQRGMSSLAKTKLTAGH